MFHFWASDYLLILFWHYLRETYLNLQVSNVTIPINLTNHLSTSRFFDFCNGYLKKLLLMWSKLSLLSMMLIFSHFLYFVVFHISLLFVIFLDCKIGTIPSWWFLVQKISMASQLEIGFQDDHRQTQKYVQGWSTNSHWHESIFSSTYWSKFHIILHHRW